MCARACARALVVSDRRQQPYRVTPVGRVTEERRPQGHSSSLSHVAAGPRTVYSLYALLFSVSPEVQGGVNNHS